MRKHFIPLIATTAAALTIAGASAASASNRPDSVPHNGATIASTSAAGYEASNRDFRFITSLVRIPDWYSSTFYPQAYIQLSNGSLNGSGTSVTGNQYVRAGVEPCDVAQYLSGGASNCTSGDWVAYVEAFNNSLNAPYWSHYVDLAGASAGDGVNFSIYYNEPGDELDFTITPPTTSGTPQYYKTKAYGPIFDHASALVDFTDSTGTAYPLPPGLNPIKEHNEFMEGALTTYSGARGSFVGPWTTSQVDATSNGLTYPSGTVRVQPGPLGTDGLAANGAKRAGDCFSESLVG